MKEVFKEVEQHMKHALDHFHHDLKQLRTGRASLSLLEGVTVEYYGTPTPLNALA
ncbi:MAG TPA: ribosome recycling factor, partial [Thermoanaerobaculia bacterium]|nr:ribosome recycling factor [Thermoanaerobaculia bacterium]